MTTSMRVTVCELPHEPRALEHAWSALCAHTAREAPELVLLPELAMVEPMWETEQLDLARWRAAEECCDGWLARLPELRAAYVVGTRPSTAPLRRKSFLPDEAGSWEARWFDRGDAPFSPFRAGAMSFGLNICTELWALESYADYARRGVHAILSPRATASATTSCDAPFVTMDVDLDASTAARASYPRYVFG
jgi:N-carbamoylputrescine amidase